MRLVLTPCTLTLIVAAHLSASGAAADEAPGLETRTREAVPITLRAVHMRELVLREEPAAEPPSRERWLDHFGTTKGGFKYQDNFVVGERKMKWSVKGPFLRSQEPGVVFEIKF
jgi:hypothetical protein